MGHHCRICGKTKPNEKFSGKGHARNACKECARKPQEEIEKIEIIEDLFGFLAQSRISEKNLKRLKVLSKHTDERVSEMAGELINVAMIAPGKKKRWRKIKSENSDLYRRCSELGFTDVPY